ncbi:hypothetical protein AYR56_07425 [Loigolactobacillus backii]|uniref:DNA-directed RNA polymerase beta subunit n=1 Tax=Loigolactobacillus backii TaxID=375175 RepID=A0A192H408_9LACO|nr:hypothetical protein [Loigolactobacillus backii]ANK62988.1 hypothetical protein AYR53_09580 [Loigolactobacillus backii]ANK70004.1 hypothetical protein AYR56_07425 [Loigolactobacillus backii]
MSVVYDVPRDKWLYDDRGMMKWMGFFMSDHTMYMEAEQGSEAPALPRPIQDSKRIDTLLTQSWTKKWTISIQLGIWRNGQLLPDLKGVVIGQANHSVVIQEDDGTLRQILPKDIRNITASQNEKWFSYEHTIK